MGYNDKRDEIIEGLADELFSLLDSTGFKLVETRTDDGGEATYGSKQLISDALASAVDPFLRRAFEIGSGNGKEVKAEDAHHEERVLRPIHFIEGAPPPPKSPSKKMTRSEVMLEEKLSGLLPLSLRQPGAKGELVYEIDIADLVEIAGHAADAFIVEHLRSQGFDLNKEIYRERNSVKDTMVYRQRR